jgi:hypothetical protein
VTAGIEKAPGWRKSATYRFSGPHKGLLRSIIDASLAEAMAEQWGGLDERGP